MDATLKHLPNDVAQLKALVASQQEAIERSQEVIGRSQEIIEQERAANAAKQTRIKVLEEMLRSLQQQRFARSSEKHPGQVELQFFNEAELLALEAVLVC